MKKVLSFIILMVCAVTGAWADTSVNLSDGTLTITTTEAGTLSSQTFTDEQKAATTIVLVGKFSSADLEAINRNHGFTSVTTVNMKNAVFNAATSNSHMIFSSEDARTSYNNNVADYAKSVVGSLYKSEYGKEIVFFLKQNGSWTKVDNLPEGATQKTPENWMTLSGFSNNDYSWWGANNDYVQLEQNNDELGWQLVSSFTEGETHDLEGRIYASTDAMEDPASADLYALVGGSEKMYNGGAWGDVTEAYDWTQMAFGGWEGLETIILPDNFNRESGKNYNNFYGNNKSTLQRIERGDSYAIIGSSNNNYTADIYCADDDRANMKAIVGLDNFVTQDANITYANPNDNDYITWNETTQVYDVHVTSAGSLASKFQKLYNTVGANDLDGKVFRFDSECTGFTAEDLQALAHANGPFVYVDLYNVAATEAVETAISDALKGNDSGVSALANNQHYKGLLLPSDPQQIGTALIANTGSSSPVSEFIAYKSGTTTVAHIYDTSASDESKYEPKVTALKGIMDAHSDIASGSSVYLVSTNCKTPIGNVATIKGTSTTASIVHTYNNEMVNPDETNPTKPSIEVIPAAAGGYATLNEATNMRNTPNTETLKFKGNINADDILAVNSFTQTHWDNTTNSYVENNPKVYNGPRVLDLSEVPASQITQSLLNNLENPEIQYIILPAGMDAPVVGDYAKLTNLKCVISSDNSSTEGDKVFNAYVKVAGSLSEARCIATGNNDQGNSTFKPTAQGLTTVKLSGNLNANDIATGSDSGGLNGEQGTITSIDLEGAYFTEINDMKLGQNGAGLINLTEVKLPTNKDITKIPARCLYGIETLTNLHIPYNYEEIGWEAFWQTGLDHITTEGANHVVIDNGPKTYTLSANIKVLGEADHGEGTAVFPQTKAVTDVYCLASEVPTCYAHTFHADMVYGNGGMGDGPYCREKYIKSANEAIALLHFPSQESYRSATGDESVTGYNDMVSKYTDPTRAYTKKDQTGAVDGNGKSLTWPDQSELLGARNMALAGHIWEDYNPHYASDGHMESLGDPIDTSIKDFHPNFVGWHEFILSQATYVEQSEEDVSEYEETEWYTFCIPFDMNYRQVVDWLGIPKSEGNKVNKLVSKDGTSVVDRDMLPDVRQLVAVHRTSGNGTGKNIVRLTMTTNLIEGTSAKYLSIDLATDKVQAVDAQPINQTYNADTKRILVGGLPYIIKAYKRKGEVIKGQNLGKLIMTRYGDQFDQSASTLENGTGSYEQLGDGELVTLQFAIPFEHHKILATHTVDNQTSGSVYTENGVQKKYYYTMVGQFWQQPLPKYCIYMSHSMWYRYTKTSLGYTWDPYKCVIMATQELVKEDGAKHYGGGYRRGADDEYTNYPQVEAGTTDLIKSELKLGFLDGRDDDDFATNGAARYIFSFDDDIVELDENGNEVTAIDRLDGETVAPLVSGSKVYNMAGQYVGQSVDGLTKGLYIVNGKKVVIK